MQMRKWHAIHTPRTKAKSGLILKKNRQCYLKNRDKWKPTRRSYNKLHKDHLYKMAQKRLSNPEIRQQRNATNALRDQTRRETDINYKLKKNLRCRVWSVLKGLYKSKHTMELLGCDIEQLKSHLQSKFKPNMSWDNYGKWHVDHIVPCDSFNLALPEEQEKCFNYKNLQPLWAIENLLKNNKVV